MPNQIEGLDGTHKEVVNKYCDTLRVIAKGFGRDLKDLTDYLKANQIEGVDQGEAIANSIIAYRAVEDASMRIGKVLQAINGGVSIYDKNVVGSPEIKAEDTVQ